MQTIGERLEEARKKKGISIREAAESTKIRGDYLQKFETNHFDIGLTEIYTRGFLRTYSNFLKLPADRILSDYAGLGREEIRPRQPNREVYGRMDISVATAEAGDRSTAGEEKPGTSPEPSHANRGPARARPGSSLPTGPDPAVIFKYVKWGGVVVIALLVILILKSLFSGGKSPVTAQTGSPSNASAAAIRGPSIGLVALNPVQVSVRRKNPDQSDGELLFSGMLGAGETRTVPWPGEIYIEASESENLRIEIKGKRYPMGLPPGYQKGQLPAPSP